MPVQRRRVLVKKTCIMRVSPKNITHHPTWAGMSMLNIKPYRPAHYASSMGWNSNADHKTQHTLSANTPTRIRTRARIGTRRGTWGQTRKTRYCPHTMHTNATYSATCEAHQVRRDNRCDAQRKFNSFENYHVAYRARVHRRADMFWQWSNNVLEKPTRRSAGNGVDVFYTLYQAPLWVEMAMLNIV